MANPEMMKSSRFIDYRSQNTAKDELEPDRMVRIYPNPANQLLNIALLDQQDEILTCRIYDATSRLVEVVQIQPRSTFVTINTSLLDNGLYFYEMECQVGGTTSGKFNVRH